MEALHCARCMLELPAGDCGDLAILLRAMLEASEKLHLEYQKQEG
ncbi:MAG: hypothetical protein ACREYC_08700 [Gammaproteobacteria bacterium]